MLLKSQNITIAQYLECWFWKEDYALSQDFKLNESEHT